MRNSVKMANWLLNEMCDNLNESETFNVTDKTISSKIKIDGFKVDKEELSNGNNKADDFIVYYIPKDNLLSVKGKDSTAPRFYINVDKKGLELGFEYESTGKTLKKETLKSDVLSQITDILKDINVTEEWKKYTTKVSPSVVK